MKSPPENPPEIFPEIELSKSSTSDFPRKRGTFCIV